MLAQHQSAGALGEFKLFQGAHAEQNLFAAKAGGDDGAHIAQPDFAKFETWQHGAIAGGLAIGGVQHHRCATLQPQPFGQFGRHRDISGAGVEQKGDRLAVENRAPSANLAETAAFMDDQKRILVFSDAGGTGRSYHADLTAKNQRLRVHYLLEPGWKADTAIQGLGRTNRTNQKQPPLFRPPIRI